MLLERVEIAGFRGIKRLSLALESGNVLIGENAWGKSSLLDALTLLLAPQATLYHFTRHDFWQSADDGRGRERHLHIVLTLRESQPAEGLHRRNAGLQSLWISSDGPLRRVIYRLEGEMTDDGTVMTLRSFLNAQGQPLELPDIDGLAKELIRLCPVLRLRDARFTRRRHDAIASTSESRGTMRQLDFLVRDLSQRQQGLNSSQLRHGLSAIVQLLEHYFAEQGSVQTRYRLMRRRSQDEQQSWRYLDMINRLLERPGRRGWRLVLMNLFFTLLQARGTVQLDKEARPLLLVEDPETRLHPIMLSVAWHLFNLLPLQKVTTTNSSELISMTPIEQVCRLVRNERVVAWRLGGQGLNAEDHRRIAFHIRFKRPSSLFARCWLLVEGETEVWMINELASQCGHHFAAEGVRVIEFAQSGLRPLIQFAQRMGIDWHVLCDGDEAGRKYAALARTLSQKVQGREHDHLTLLPARDIEHFMYREGFAQVYHRVARLPDNVPITVHRVIAKAIHRSSKPDLAIEVSMMAAQRGSESIPLLFRQMFSRVLWLARGQGE